MKKKVAATMAVVFVTVFLLGSVVLVRLRMGDRQEALAFQITNNFSAVHSSISENVPQEQKPQNVLDSYTQRAIGALEEELALYNHFHRRSQGNQVWNDLLYYVDRMATKTLPEQNASEGSRQKGRGMLGYAGALCAGAALHRGWQAVSQHGGGAAGGPEGGLPDDGHPRV